MGNLISTILAYFRPHQEQAKERTLTMYKTYFKKWLWLLVIAVLIPLITLLLLPEKITLERCYHMFTIWMLIFGLISSSYEFMSNSLAYKEFKKRENAERFSRAYDDEYLRVAREFTREQRKNREKISNNDLLENINNNNELYISLIHTFNFWERVALSIKMDTSDEDYLFAFFSDIYIEQYKCFEVWIDSVLQKQNKLGYEQLKFLYSRWSNKKNEK